MYYFAYGSNMDENQMKERLVLTNFKRIGLANLRGWKLAQTRWAIGQKAGVADVIPSQHYSVWGVVYEIDDLREMDFSRDVVVIIPARLTSELHYRQVNSL